MADERLTPATIVAWQLRTLDDARESHPRGQGDGGNIGMPHDWRTYYKPLEEALTTMRHHAETRQKGDPAWHATQRYRHRWQLKTELRVTRTRQGPEVKLPPHHEHATIIEHRGHLALVRVYRWNPKVKQNKADSQCAALARIIGNPQLPPAVMRHALGLPLEQEKLAA